MKAIMTKYLGPTDRRGARIKASDLDRNSVTVSYDHASHDPHRDAAVALIRKMGWHGTWAEGGTQKGDVFVCIDHAQDVFKVEPEGGAS